MVADPCAVRGGGSADRTHPGRDKVCEMTYTGGNAKDGKHYWLTPPELMEQIWHEFGITFDPCPFPKPYDFDGLTAEWGESNYVNPSFGGYIDDNGKKRGPTAWARKAIKEYQKGKRLYWSIRWMDGY